MPKGFRKKINFINQKIGVERRQEMFDEIADKGTYLPKGITYEDIDETFIEFVDKDLSIVIDGEKVPALFLTLQRWSEFAKTWSFTDKYKDVKMPFITIVRQPNPQVGTNQAGLYNIPGHRTYTYIKVPTFIAGRRGFDTYKIPQPVSVDFIYEVRLFCDRMRDLNKLNFKIQQAFQSIQYYVKVNGHPRPIILEDIGDESNIDDFENRRFYVQSFQMKLLGYVQNEDDFEVIPAINRLVTTLEVDNKELPKNNFEIKNINDILFYTMIFKGKTNTSLTFNSFDNIKITKFYLIEKISNIQILVNNIEVFNGISLLSDININKNDKITINVTKGFFDIGKLILNAIII